MYITNCTTCCGMLLQLCIQVLGLGSDKAVVWMLKIKMNI